MARIKASDLPEQLQDAFIDALEAWTDVERELFMLFQFVGASHIEEEWGTFSLLKALDAQVAETLSRLEDAGLPDDLKAEAGKLLARLRKKAKTRNRIVHGHWDRTEFRGSYEYYRRYELADRAKGRPTSGRDRDRLKGSVIFEVDDLQAAERTFRSLARDVHLFKNSLVGPLYRSPTSPWLKR